MIENGIDRDNIAVVYNQSDFDNIDVNSVERVLGEPQSVNKHHSYILRSTNFSNILHNRF